MASRRPRPAWRALTAVAGAQGGYVTTGQAASAGFDRRLLSYHHRVGNLERGAWGLYRLPDLPTDEHDDLLRVRLSLRSAASGTTAVFSHLTALGLHGLSDLFPDSIHLTVPRSFRGKSPEGCHLHRETLAPADVQPWKVGGLTTPLRTLIDVAEDRRIPTEQVEVAVRDAIEGQLVLPAELEPVAAGRLLAAWESVTG